MVATFFEAGFFGFFPCSIAFASSSLFMEVVSEMVRVTKPKGKILASLEPDYGGKIHWPENQKVDPLFAGEAIQKKGGDPHIGRKLREFFSFSYLGGITHELQDADVAH